MNAIESAVTPLRADAIQRAEQEANTIIQRCTGKLEESGFDLSLVAPYPKTNIGRSAYMLAISRRQTFGMLVKHESKGSRRLGEPELVSICPEKVERFINNAKEDAAEQYDVFIAKLVAKIGAVETATLTGNHVWSFSILKVTKKGGAVENWKTQQIVNVSKLGKLFNQWPTRKVK